MGEKADNPQSRIATGLEMAKRRSEHAAQIRQTKLHGLSLEAKKIDEHVKDFLAIIKEDAHTHDKESLKAHAKDFDALISSELEFLFKTTKEDIKLFSRVLLAISEYREHLGTLFGEEEFSKIAVNELNYAETLMQDAGDKLATLQLLFKKLKGK